LASRRIAVMTAIVAGSLLAPSAGDAASASRAAPAASAARLLAAGSPVTLASLEARAAKLSQQYRGQIVTLTESADAAKAAAGKALLLSRQLAGAHQQIARLAAAAYMSSALDPALALLI
jgi:hypothetical protein